MTTSPVLLMIWSCFFSLVRVQENLAYGDDYASDRDILALPASDDVWRVKDDSFYDPDSNPRGCPKGRYGASCDGICRCQDGEECNKVSGACSGGCSWRYDGFSCSNTCPTNRYFVSGACTGVCHCQDQWACRVSDGRCMVGSCLAGWEGSNCNLDCPRGKFGLGCSSLCHCANEVSCDRVTGKCPSGCVDGFTGPSCDISLSTASVRHDITLPATIAIAVGACIILILLGLLISVIVHYRSAFFKLWGIRPDLKKYMDNEMIDPVTIISKGPDAHDSSHVIPLDPTRFHLFVVPPSPRVRSKGSSTNTRSIAQPDEGTSQPVCDRAKSVNGWKTVRDAYIKKGKRGEYDPRIKSTKSDMDKMKGRPTESVDKQEIIEREKSSSFMIKGDKYQNRCDKILNSSKSDNTHKVQIPDASESDKSDTSNGVAIGESFKSDRGHSKSSSHDKDVGHVSYHSHPSHGKLPPFVAASRTSDAVDVCKHGRYRNIGTQYSSATLPPSGIKKKRPWWKVCGSSS